MARDRESRQDGLEERVVKIRRCAAVVKGGRRFSFNALVVVGDKRGGVACGYGKANEVPPAVEKATKDAKNALRRQRRIALEGDAALAAQGVLGVLGGLLHGGGHFVGLAVAAGHAAALVADDDQRVEAEAPTALDHGGAAADLYHTVFQTVGVLIAAVPIPIACHVRSALVFVVR